MPLAKKIRSFLPVIGLVFLLVILASVDREKIWSVLSKADLSLLALALATNGLVVIIKGVKWRTFFFDKKNKVSTSECIQGFLKGFFLSVVTPGRIGDFARAFFVKGKVGFSFGLASVILDRLTDIILLLALSFLSLVAFFFLTQNWIVNPLLILALIAALLLGVFYVLRKSKKGFFRSFFFAITPERYRTRVQNTYGKITQELRDAGRHKSELFLGSILGIIIWFFCALAGFWIGSAIGIQQPFYFFGIIVLLLALLEIIPITFAGLGTREAGAIFLFSTVGISAETAVAYSLLLFFTAYIPISVLGGLLFMQKPDKL
ncbi:MAG: lysylphosphatidylglycerol synthase transmembrane domain-containing protein [Candidatus Micrarchaeota archaeon]